MDQGFYSMLSSVEKAKQWKSCSTHICFKKRHQVQFRQETKIDVYMVEVLEDSYNKKFRHEKNRYTWLKFYRTVAIRNFAKKPKLIHMVEVL